MVYQIADNVLSPLGATTTENYKAIKAGCSALRYYTSYSGRTEDDYVASRFSDNQRQQLMIKGLTWFESLVYHSAKEALSNCQIDISSKRTLFVLSTTKANIEHLSSQDYPALQPAESAQRIANLLGIKTQPIVVCNACISGVAAIITAQRLLNAGCFDTAIVAGCDVISHFVVSGFQSLKALSQEPCRPFDIERIGLNLGEAAATLILSTTKPQKNKWQIVSGAIRNDAYHISSPSPKGEGCSSAINYVTENINTESIAAVNVHGTATMYNDQMESKAIAASGLLDVPINTLKGYFGHTLGASGLLETIITMYSVGQGELPATCGFHELGVSERVNISEIPVSIRQHSFVKIISGFGGCNAALYCERGLSEVNRAWQCQYKTEHSVKITPNSICIDGKLQKTDAKGYQILTETYKSHIASYPRYYKMDRLCQLGFVASELLSDREQPRQKNCSDRAVVLFNHTSSVCADNEYEQSILDEKNYFPSPSLFVYTLPNILCGEIAIRNGYHAETSFYIISDKNRELMSQVLQSTFMDHNINSILTGWVDYQDDNNFEADFRLIKRLK